MEEETLENPSPNQHPTYQTHQNQQWEAVVQTWLSSMPDGKYVSMSEFEPWFDSICDSLPEDFKSVHRTEIYGRFLMIQRRIALQNQEKEVNPARFQRTDQWMPVYSWLESLDQDEVIKSKDVTDWLAENHQILEQLSAKHSRYHLMHYIKKCHLKILKRREKQQGIQQPSKAVSLKVPKIAAAKPATLPYNNMSTMPEDNDVYIAKRNEAFQKYEILVELEKQLSTLFPKHQNMTLLMES